MVGPRYPLKGGVIKPSYLFPGSPWPPFFRGWFPSFTIILVGVYHLLKGTIIFKMVVDFQGIYKAIYRSPITSFIAGDKARLVV